MGTSKGIDGREGRINADSIDDPLLLPRAEQCFALESQGNGLRSEQGELLAVVGIVG